LIFLESQHSWMQYTVKARKVTSYMSMCSFVPSNSSMNYTSYHRSSSLQQRHLYTNVFLMLTYHQSLKIFSILKKYFVISRIWSKRNKYVQLAKYSIVLLFKSCACFNFIPFSSFNHFYLYFSKHYFHNFNLVFTCLRTICSFIVWVTTNEIAMNFCDQVF